MADECPQKRLRREVICSICLEYFTDPHRVDCGHGFCRACIDLCLTGSSAEATCPQCQAPIQPQNFEPNRDMARFVEIAKQMNGHSEMEAAEKDLCESHQEPLKYFCKNDQVHICLVCKNSESHKAHVTMTVKSAAHEVKFKLLGSIMHVRKQRDDVRNYLITLTSERNQLVSKIKNAQDRMTTDFLGVRNYLSSQEAAAIVELDEVENEIVRKRNKDTSWTEEEIASYDEILDKMAKMRFLPEDKLLQQAGNNLEWWSKKVFQEPVAYPPELKLKVSERCDFEDIVRIATGQIDVVHWREQQRATANLSEVADPAAKPDPTCGWHWPRLKRSAFCSLKGGSLQSETISPKQWWYRFAKDGRASLTISHSVLLKARQDVCTDLIANLQWSLL